MPLFDKTESKLDRRLKDVNREISRLNREMRGAARSALTRAAAPAEAEQKQPPPGDEPLQTPKPDGVFPDFRVRKRDPDEQLDLFDQGEDGSGRDPDPRIRPGKERFASYFMAGHFTEMRPLRQERRIMRNKAIFMAVFAILALIWFMYMRFLR